MINSLFLGYINNGDIMRVLITGATSGIAYTLGAQLAKRGHTVYFTTHTVKQLHTLENKMKKDKISALAFKMDITTKDVELVDKLHIDCFINHAGVGYGGSLLYMDIDHLRENYETNLFSSFDLLKRVYHNMKKEKIPGKIFVMSSTAAYLPIPFLGCYTSSKAAVSMLVRTIKKELDYLKSDISISLIEPGAYQTGFNQVMIENKSEYLDPESVFYQDLDKINHYQKNLFAILEKEDWMDLVQAILKEIEREHPKFLIRRPWYMTLFLRFSFLFFG